MAWAGARFRGSDSMPSQKLTAKQHRLKAEIEEIAAFIQMDHWNILNYEEDRTTYLEIMKLQLVRGDIVTKYTLIDELLAVDICHYYFKRAQKGFSFREQWKTQKFRVFNHYIIDETFLMKKMAIAHAIKEIPAPIRSAIARINDVRNAISHSFFPENRRQYAQQKKVIYQGFNIFTLAGMEKFAADFAAVKEYFWQRLGWD
jgi:hypothetical protein